MSFSCDLVSLCFCDLKKGGRMRLGNVLTFAAGFGLALMVWTPSAQASIFIHEILADPPAIGGDANGDGIVSISADEFIELYNDSAEAVNLSGWSIADAIKVRHIFPQNTWIDPLSVFLIFSGGDPKFDSSLYNTASTGSLGLNNSGDQVKLFDLSGTLFDLWDYGSEGGKDQSIVRINGEEFLHTDLHAQQRFSPGSFSGNADTTHAVPETDTLFALMIGIVGFCFVGKQRFFEKI